MSYFVTQVNGKIRLDLFSNLIDSEITWCLGSHLNRWERAERLTVSDGAWLNGRGGCFLLYGKRWRFDRFGRFNRFTSGVRLLSDEERGNRILFEDSLRLLLFRLFERRRVNAAAATARSAASVRGFEALHFVAYAHVRHLRFVHYSQAIVFASCRHPFRHLQYFISISIWVLYHPFNRYR